MQYRAKQDIDWTDSTVHRQGRSELIEKPFTDIPGHRHDFQRQYLWDNMIHEQDSSMKIQYTEKTVNMQEI